MPRDMNKPQGKPYVYEPPVQKFREKMGNREKHQQFKVDKRELGQQFKKRQHIIDNSDIWSTGTKIFIALFVLAVLAFASTVPAVQNLFKSG